MAYRRYAFAALVSLTLFGCPSPEAPKPPPQKPVTEEEARDAYDRAKKKKDPDALLEVFNKYPKLKSGKSALKMAARLLRDAALESAEECDEPAAKGSLAKIAPYTSDDTEIDSLYDEVNAAVKREKARCALKSVDADVKKAEEAWDWPRAFNRIKSEKEAEGGALKKRREELTARWAKWIDGTLTKIVEKKSVLGVVGDKRALFLDSVDSGKLPDELSAEIAKRADVMLGVLLVFDKLEGGQLIDPPTRYWTFGNAKARKPDAPTSTDGATISNGVPFFAVAKGKIGGVTLLVAGKEGATPLERLATVKLLIPESDARTYDTNMTLPDKLVGVRVLAPVVPGAGYLTPSIVLSETKGVIIVEPLKKKGAKLVTKRSELRGLSIPPGQFVEVMIGGDWKKGELVDPLEENRALIKVGGFESYFPLAEIRVKRADLPKPPD